MLEAKVTEPVILHWLDTSGRHPAEVGSRELIELKRAAAPDRVTEKLLDLAKRPPAERRGSEPASSPSSPSSGAKSGAASPSTKATSRAASKIGGGQASSSPGTTAGSGTPARGASAAESDAAHPRAPGPHAASLHWVVEYHPNFLADDERWDLFVYLDGRYLAWVKAPRVSFLEKPMEFDHNLSPGHHAVRLLEERHVRKPNTNDWENRARVAPKAFEVDVRPDTAGKVELRLEVKTRGGPISLRLTQGGEEVAKQEPSVPLPENWPPLCEEVPGQREPCLHWADLWPGVSAPPSREDVRDDLERRQFHPDPAQGSQ